MDGDSGFVNLMQMKCAYFQSIRGELMQRIDRRAEKGATFREELFDKLYTFFNRYFCESGSIYFRRLPAFSKTYERVYADGQDVALSWKTQMLYYVKSDVLVRSMPVELSEEGKPQSTRRFYFDASQVEHKQNNERREFVFAFDKVKRGKEGRVVHLEVSYSQKGAKTKTDEILKQSRKGGVSLTEDQLQKAIGVFRRQTEADFFINKDAKGFLREQFDLWLYQYIFEGETIFEPERFNQLQALRQTAYDIIDFIAQFEDELRRVWEKPKFVRNVNYVVTLDKLPDKTLRKLTKHKGAAAQIKEWRTLGMVDGKFSMAQLFKGQKSLTDKNDASGQYQFLPVDTRHFKEMELEILDGLGNLDEALDGELVHSENWQALNTLQGRYREKVKCIYIDPPYNSPSSEIVYKNRFKHSTWLSLMENRLLLSQSMQAKDGILVVAIDENENERLSLMLNDVYSDQYYEKNSITIRHNTKGIQGGFVSINNETVITISPVGIKSNERKIEPKHREYYNFRNWGGESERHTAKRCFYPIYVKRNRIVGFGDVCDDSYHPPLNVKMKDGRVAVYPVDIDGIERKWTYARGSVEAIKHLLRVKKLENGKIDIEKCAEYQRYKTVWTDSKYVAGDYGSKILNNILGEKKFDFPKSIHAVKDCINLSSGNDFTVLDYFAGSGTTAHAVINLNREDGGNRKYLLIEMGDYFHTVLLPRIKKVVYSKDWKEGKPASNEGSSHFLKYYTLEQYEETLRNARFRDGEQLELDSTKSPFEQYVFFGDDKLAHAVKPLKSGKLKINLRSLYPDMDIAESLSNILGKPIRKRTADSVTFADDTTEKTNPAKMTAEEQRHFVSLIKPYLWWGE